MLIASLGNYGGRYGASSWDGSDGGPQRCLSLVHCFDRSAHRTYRTLVGTLAAARDASVDRAGS